MKYQCVATCTPYLLDTETPISIYLKLREHFKQCILLENAEKGLEQNRLSFICFEPIAGIEIKGLNITTSYPDQTRTKELCEANSQVLPKLIKFCQLFSFSELHGDFPAPGLFGYTAYDAVRYFEDIDIPVNENGIPEIQYHLYRFVIVIDHLKNELKFITVRTEDEEKVNEQAVLSILHKGTLPVYPFHTRSAERNNCTDEYYLDAVEKGKRHCYRGDVFQVVLSRAFETDFYGDDFNVYRALRSINPSPYLFYCDYNSFHLFGSSPEAQIKLSRDKASIHPIAGTYRRTGDLAKDDLLSQQLMEDRKENAEHIMLVDLARNDLSKHYNKVSLTDYRKIEKYSHVIHLVSVVEGKEPIAGSHPLQVLADTFPAGTLSGAPKHEAMKIIERTEPTARGFYGGCVGFLGFDGSVNTAIMIRSFLSKGNTLHYQAGAGITAASVPENELQEINNKIDALRKAINLANSL